MREYHFLILKNLAAKASEESNLDSLEKSTILDILNELGFLNWSKGYLLLLSKQAVYMWL